jgi:hypothetical protein
MFVLRPRRRSSRQSAPLPPELEGEAVDGAAPICLHLLVSYRSSDTADRLRNPRGQGGGGGVPQYECSLWGVDRSRTSAVSIVLVAR